jgi:hypothetical protein
VQCVGFGRSLVHRMARTLDALVPEDEALYRSVAKEHIVEGIGVLAAAVEMPACSFNRSKYSHDTDVVVPSRPAENGILEITPRELPPPVPRADELLYEFFVADDPIESNDAHCEVRLRRSGLAYTKGHKPNPAIKAKACEELARRMRIRRAPT